MRKPPFRSCCLGKVLAMQYDCSLDQTVDNMNVIMRAHMRMDMDIAHTMAMRKNELNWSRRAPMKGHSGRSSTSSSRKRRFLHDSHCHFRTERVLIAMCVKIQGLWTTLSNEYFYPTTCPSTCVSVATVRWMMVPNTLKNSLKKNATGSVSYN